MNVVKLVSKEMSRPQEATAVIFFWSKNHESVQKMAEFSSQSFTFELMTLQYDLDQAKQHCQLFVHYTAD